MEAHQPLARHRNKRLSTSNVYFDELRWQFEYVDKSDMIRQIQSSEFRSILMARPTKWGKTVALSMLEKFYSCDETPNKMKPSTRPLSLQLLEGNSRLYPLEITLSEEWQAIKQYSFQKYVVIRLDLSLQKIEESFRFGLQRKILKAYQSKSWLSLTHYKQQYDSWVNKLEKEALDIDLNRAMLGLIDMVSAVYERKVVLLIDNYDSILLTSDFKVKSIQQKRQDIQLLLSLIEISKQQTVYRTVICGIYNIIPPQKTDFIASSLYDDGQFLKKSMGFSEDEVKQLIERIFLSFSETTKAEIFEQIRQNFGGYVLGNEPNCLFFNNISVIQYLQMVSNTCLDESIPVPAINFQKDTQFLYFEQENLRCAISLLQTHRSQFFVCAQWLFSLLQGQTRQLFLPQQLTKAMTQNCLYQDQKVIGSDMFLYFLVNNGYCIIDENYHLVLANKLIKQFVSSVFESWIERQFLSNFKGFRESINARLSSWKYFDQSLSPVVVGSFSKFIQNGQAIFRYLSFLIIKRHFSVNIISSCNIQSAGNSLSFTEDLDQDSMILIFHRYQITKIYGKNEAFVNNMFDSIIQQGLREMFYETDLKNTISSIEINLSQKKCEKVLLRAIVLSYKDTKIIVKEIVLSIRAVKQILIELEKRMVGLIEDRVYQAADELLKGRQEKSWTSLLTALEKTE